MHTDRVCSAKKCFSNYQQTSYPETLSVKLNKQDVAVVSAALYISLSRQMVLTFKADDINIGLIETAYYR